MGLNIEKLGIQNQKFNCILKIPPSGYECIKQDFSHTIDDGYWHKGVTIRYGVIDSYLGHKMKKMQKMD